MATLSPDLAQSYRAAQAITREHARTFYFASHVLTQSVRFDAYAVYACCRSIDDAVDQVAARGESVRPEVAGEMLIRAFEDGGDRPGEEWMPAFRDCARRTKILRRWFEDLAIGVAGDAGPVNLQTWEELDLYCYRVAGTVGLMMMRVFGSDDPQAEPRALDLGRGMQLTNILRDVAEDARARRIYLPAREREVRGACRRSSDGTTLRSLERVYAVSGLAGSGAVSFGRTRNRDVTSGRSPDVGLVHARAVRGDFGSDRGLRLRCFPNAPQPLDGAEACARDWNLVEASKQLNGL